MRKNFLYIGYCFIVVVITVLYASCSKEPGTPTSSFTAIYSPLPPPPPPPPPSSSSPYYYVYFQSPRNWDYFYQGQDSIKASFDLREYIFNSNSVIPSMIDSLSIQETSGLVFNILDTTNNGGYWYEDVLESWLPGWEYKWVIRIIRKAKINDPFTINPPAGKVVVRFRL